jgi:deazaflavin-dependent oxidoreductase (nitroreductase family)
MFASSSPVLEVRGCKSGEWRRTPVNLLTYEGDRYLVAPRGHTQWVRNLRASGRGRLVVGRRSEGFTASEVDDEEKPVLLRRSGNGEVGVFSTALGPTRPTTSCAASPQTTRPSALHSQVTFF